MISKLLFRFFGLFLYLFDPKFRAIVDRKRRSRKGLNERVRHGETVVAVLNSDSPNRRTIE